MNVGMNLVEWAQYVTIAIGGAFGLFCIFDGTRRAVGGNEDGRGGKLLLMGLTIVGMLAAHAYWQHWNLLDAARAYRSGEAPRELSADWGRRMSPAKREAASQNYARSAYVSAGVLRQHFDISGQRKNFIPAADDIKRRDGVIANQVRYERKAEEFFQAFILWLVLGVSAFVFGFAFALEPAPKPVQAEERIEPTAPAAAPIAAGAAKPPPQPAATPQPAVAQQATPQQATAPKPAAKPVGSDTVPLPAPPKAVGTDTVPLPRAHRTEGDTTVPLPKSNVGSDTVPLPKPPPGAFTPPKKT